MLAVCTQLLPFYMIILFGHCRHRGGGGGARRRRRRFSFVFYRQLFSTVWLFTAWHSNKMRQRHLTTFGCGVRSWHGSPSRRPFEKGTTMLLWPLRSSLWGRIPLFHASASQHRAYCAVRHSSSDYDDAKSSVNANTHGNAESPMNYCTLQADADAVNAGVTIIYILFYRTDIASHRTHIILFSTVLSPHCQKTKRIE